MHVALECGRAEAQTHRRVEKPIVAMGEGGAGPAHAGVRRAAQKLAPGSECGSDDPRAPGARGPVAEPHLPLGQQLDLGFDLLRIEGRECLAVRAFEADSRSRVSWRISECRAQRRVREEAPERRGEVDRRGWPEIETGQVAEPLPLLQPGRHRALRLVRVDTEDLCVRVGQCGERDPLLERAPQEGGRGVEEVELLAVLGEEEPGVVESEEIDTGRDVDRAAHPAIPTSSSRLPSWSSSAPSWEGCGILSS